MYCYDTNVTPPPCEGSQSTHTDMAQCSRFVRLYHMDVVWGRHDFYLREAHCLADCCLFTAPVSVNNVVGSFPRNLASKVDFNVGETCSICNFLIKYRLSRSRTRDLVYCCKLHNENEYFKFIGEKKL